MLGSESAYSTKEGGGMNDAIYYVAPTGFSCTVGRQGKKYNLSYTEWFDVSQDQWNEWTNVISDERYFKVETRYLKKRRRGFVYYNFVGTKLECLKVICTETMFQVAAEDHEVTKQIFKYITKLHKNGGIAKVTE